MKQNCLSLFDSLSEDGITNNNVTCEPHEASRIKAQ